MTGERDLDLLLRRASPRRADGEYVFTRLEPGAAVPADALGLPYTFVAAWITLEVHSALEAVGLTAAFSTALANAGIAANVVAGHTHDHVFVPVARAAEALRVLGTLSSDPPA